MKIAIIGGGLSGSNVLKTILEHPHFSKNISIDIFDPRKRLGPGMPYAPDDQNVMLNSQPKGLSVDMEQPNDFVDWLNEHYQEPTNFEDLISRPQYGEYLFERFEACYQHPQVTHIAEEVVDVKVDVEKEADALYHHPEAHSYHLETATGFKETAYDAIFFAPGHPPYRNDYDLLGEENYIHNPYPLNEGLSHLTNTQKIGVIGSGAASVDYFRYLTQNYQLEQPLTFYVRKDAFLFPVIPYEGEPYQATVSHDWIVATKNKMDGFIPLATIIDTIDNDLQAVGADIHRIYQEYHDYDVDTVARTLESKDQELAVIQAYISEMGPLLPHLFNALNGIEKDTYLQDYHTKLLFFRNLIPHKTAVNLLEHYQAGKVRIVFGLSDIIPQADGRFKMIAEEEEYTDVLVNGTGFQSNLANASEQDELIHNLYKQKLILPHQNGNFVLVDWPRCRIINQRFGVLNHAFFLGHFIKGAQHENNNAKMITQQAIFSAQWLMDNYQ